MTEPSNSPPWHSAYQVGVVVEDLDRAIRFYETLGVGPFIEGPSAHALDRRIRGRPEPEAEVAGRTARLGNIELELLQPISGVSIQKEFLETRGEGVIHICAHTDHLDSDIRWMQERGFKVISSAHLADGGKFSYFDTQDVGGIILELFQPGGRWR